MSKRKYHAESLDQVEIGGIFKKINSDKVIVADEIAKEDFFASVAGGWSGRQDHQVATSNANIALS